MKRDLKAIGIIILFTIIIVVLLLLFGVDKMMPKWVFSSLCFVCGIPGGSIVNRILTMKTNKPKNYFSFGISPGWQYADDKEHTIELLPAIEYLYIFTSLNNDTRRNHNRFVVFKWINVRIVFIITHVQLFEAQK